MSSLALLDIRRGQLLGETLLMPVHEKGGKLNSSLEGVQQAIGSPFLSSNRRYDTLAPYPGEPIYPSCLWVWLGSVDADLIFSLGQVTVPGFRIGWDSV